mgnify:CR=1 FL=1
MALSCSQMRPSLSTVTLKGSSCPGKGELCAAGRSTATPEVSMGAVIMNTIRSTSMTSTKGVMLISTMVEAGAGALKYSRRTLWMMSKCSMLRT